MDTNTCGSSTLSEALPIITELIKANLELTRLLESMKKDCNENASALKAELHSAKSRIESYEQRMADLQKRCDRLQEKYDKLHETYERLMEKYEVLAERSLDKGSHGSAKSDVKIEL